MSKNKIPKKWRDTNRYINNFWSQLLFSASGLTKKYPADDDQQMLYLPKPYFVPGGRFQAMFYWDSYFIMAGLRASGLKKINGLPAGALQSGMLENCFYQVGRFGHILNGNKQRWSTRSQPPFLTSMTSLVLGGGASKKQLAEAYSKAKKEYSHWISAPHLTPTGLSRYFDHTGEPYKTLSETGWDMSPRFTQKNVHNLIPIDLNANLYKYEVDLAAWAVGLGRKKESLVWLKKAKTRKTKINELMWDSKSGLFGDYDYRKKRRSTVKSLAAYQTMWAGLADSKQAEKLIKNLSSFRQKFGLAATDKNYGKSSQQWNFPTGWAPLHFLVYEGLINYGYKKEARDIARTFLNLISLNLGKTGQIWEKYNVVNGTNQAPVDRYTNQPGFGWTNAVFQKFYRDLAKP